MLKEHLDNLNLHLEALVQEARYITFRLAVINQKIENVSKIIKGIPSDDTDDLVARSEAM